MVYYKIYNLKSAYLKKFLLKKNCLSYDRRIFLNFELCSLIYLYFLEGKVVKIRTIQLRLWLAYLNRFSNESVGIKLNFKQGCNKMLSEIKY